MFTVTLKNRNFMLINDNEKIDSYARFHLRNLCHNAVNGLIDANKVLNLTKLSSVHQIHNFYYIVDMETFNFYCLGSELGDVVQYALDNEKEILYNLY